jgi:hypothetical protein
MPDIFFQKYCSCLRQSSQQLIATKSFFMFIFFLGYVFITPFNTQTKHIKSFYTQKHCYVFPKNLIPWRDSNPGLLAPEADAMPTAARRQGNPLRCTIIPL